MDSDSSLTDLSSELSSIRSSTPPVDYPTPISSQRAESQVIQDGEQLKRKHEDDDATVRKRKRAEPKPRTREFLDLTTHPRSVVTEQKDQLDVLLKVLQKRRKIVVIAGAGISVSAGSKLPQEWLPGLALTICP